MLSDPLYQAGAAHWNAGRPFEAHEHFEAAWRRGDEGRAVFQGLVQYAAAWVKLRAGNPRGFRSNAAKAAANLAGLAAAGHPALRDWSAVMREWSNADSPGEPPPALPL